MKSLILIAFCLLFCFLFSCEKVSPDVKKIDFDFEWGIEPGQNTKNPEIQLKNIPEDTKFLEVQLTDLDLSFADHGKAETVAYYGGGVIPNGSLSNYIGPSPPPGREHLYEFIIKALDKNRVVIGVGKKAKKCCQENRQNHD